MSQESAGQWFRGSSGWVWMGVAVVAAAVLVLVDASSGWNPEVGAGALFALVLAYVVMIRPAVGVVGDDLVVRQMLSTVRVPVAAVRSVYVGRMLEARAGDRRIVSPAISRSLRQVVRGSGERDPASVFGDYVEVRIEGAAAEARSRLRIEADSDEQFALARRLTRTWAWPEIAAVVVTGGLLAVLVAL